MAIQGTPAGFFVNPPKYRRVRARLVSIETTPHGHAIVRTMDGRRHALQAPSVHKVRP